MCVACVSVCACVCVQWVFSERPRLGLHQAAPESASSLCGESWLTLNCIFQEVSLCLARSASPGLPLSSEKIQKLEFPL